MWRKQPRAARIGTFLPCIIIALIFAYTILFQVIDEMYGIRIVYRGEMILVPLALGMFIGAVMRHRAWRRLRDADFLLCPVCEYRLHGLGSSGHCPECGEAFEVKSARNHWRDMLGATIKREGLVRLSDREMNSFIRISIPLLVIGSVLLGTQFARAMGGPVPGWFPVAPFLLGFALLFLQVLIGMGMSLRARYRDYD